jgi:homoserine kinase
MRAVVPVVAIPDFELSTEAARRVLPDTYSRADAIYNTAHLGLLLRGLETGNGVWLRKPWAIAFISPIARG